ncbi:MAG: CDP-alcohol phosphatidyltransferase family protein, partial [Scardovia wiggsiae]|nr:CDP-alcohol phosphatidyltransferase family protein [Scardovia wiggsiae]
MFEKLRGPWRKIISPIARALVKLGVTANMVTIAGAVGTAFFAVLTGFTGWLLPGAAMITVMVIFDSLDGTVAAQN